MKSQWRNAGCSGTTTCDNGVARQRGFCQMREAITKEVTKFFNNNTEGMSRQPLVIFGSCDCHSRGVLPLG